MARKKNDALRRPRKPWTKQELIHIWVNNGGRCALCEENLLKNSLTGDRGIYGQLAHVIAHKPSWARGDASIPEEEVEDIKNVILLCPVCHKNVDKLPDKYTTDYLYKKKEEHESQIYRQLLPTHSHTRHVVKMVAPIAGINFDATNDTLHRAMFDSGLFPGDIPTTDISIGVFRDERDDLYWTVAQEKLNDNFNQNGYPLMKKGEPIALFAIGPMPLLVQLGTLLSDLADVDVFNLYRDPQRKWSWGLNNNREGQDFIVYSPEDIHRPVDKKILILSITSSIRDRVLQQNQNEGNLAVWEITVASPGYEAIDSPRTLENFRHAALKTLDEMSKTEGDIHLYMAAPNSAAIMLGLSVRPKATRDIYIYDYIASTGQDKLAIKIQNK